MKSYSLATVVVAASLGLSGVACGQCEPEWSEAFTPALFDLLTSQPEAVVYDDGSGPRLLVSGMQRFGDDVQGLQTYDGHGWTTLPYPDAPPGVLSRLRAVGGSRPARLVVALEDFRHYLEDVYIYADGQWMATSLLEGSGYVQQAVGIEPGPDPDSGEIYVAGDFTISPGRYALVMRWDGTAWAALDDTDSPSTAYDLVWFDDGTGPALYVSVSSSIDGVDVQGVARWDGTAWEEVGGGCPAVSAPKLAVYDDGSGPALWALNSDATVLAKWDGAEWTAYPLSWFAGRRAFLAADVGGERCLVWSTSGREDGAIWRWNGVERERVAGVEGGGISALVADDAGDFGGGLIAIGTFNLAGGVPAAGVARWDGRAWHPLASQETGNGAPGAGALLSVGDEGGESLGGRLFVSTQKAGGVPSGGLVAWDGASWEAMGPPGDWTLWAHELAFGDIGDGPRVFAAGDVHDSQSAYHVVAAWDGAGWSTIADGMNYDAYALEFGAMDGGEPTLYVGGHFTRSFGDVYNFVAAITSSGLTPLGDGIPSQWPIATYVYTLRLHDDGSGTALYAGGYLSRVVEELGEGVVRWNGSAWEPVGGPLDDRVPLVSSLCSTDLGDGLRLYAGGKFEGVDRALHNVAVWDGATWSPLGDGLPHQVHTLARIETPEGPRLGATVAIGVEDLPAETLYLWDGAAWSPFGAVSDDSAIWVAQAHHEDGAIYLSGNFRQVAGVPSEGIARYGCATACGADLNGDGVVDTRDVLAFLSLWAAGDEAADINEDGIVDTRDVLAFLNLWNAGC